MIKAGFHSHGGTPIAGWFLLWTIPCKWMIWGYPYFRNSPNVGLFVPAHSTYPAFQRRNISSLGSSCRLLRCCMQVMCNIHKYQISIFMEIYFYKYTYIMYLCMCIIYICIYICYNCAYLFIYKYVMHTSTCSYTYHIGSYICINCAFIYTVGCGCKWNGVQMNWYVLVFSGIRCWNKKHYPRPRRVKRIKPPALAAYLVIFTQPSHVCHAHSF